MRACRVAHICFVSLVVHRCPSLLVILIHHPTRRGSCVVSPAVPPPCSVSLGHLLTMMRTVAIAAKRCDFERKRRSSGPASGHVCRACCLLVDGSLAIRRAARAGAVVHASPLSPALCTPSRRRLAVQSFPGIRCVAASATPRHQPRPRGQRHSNGEGTRDGSPAWSPLVDRATIFHTTLTDKSSRHHALRRRCKTRVGARGGGGARRLKGLVEPAELIASFRRHSSD